MRHKPILFLFLACSACGSVAEHPTEGTIRSLQASLSSTCSAAWNAETAYLGGNTASVQGTNYQANWWTQGLNPATASGPLGTGQPWTATGSCTDAVPPQAPTSSSAASTPTSPPTGEGKTAAACSAPWSASAVYVASNGVSRAGSNYTANWWTQGQDPATTHGVTGSGQVWTLVGPCIDAAPTTPSSPVSSIPAPTPVPVPVPGPVPGPAPANPITPVFGSTNFVLSPYKDVTISANWNTSVISTAVTGTLTPLLQAVPDVPAVTWAFATGECGSENWGGIAGAQLASANIPAWSSANKPYILSTGGAAGTFTCGSDAGFAAFIDRYASSALLGIDFDIEAGQNQAVIDALVQRVKTAQQNSKYANLRFSFTLATLGGSSPQSLGSMGIMVMQSIQNAGLQHYIINLMAMDYGSPTATNCTLGANGLCAMGLSATQAAVNLHSYYGVPYQQIEITPMIGGNDTQNETFTLGDASIVTAFAKQNNLAGVHFWSLDRDRDCAAGYASPTCNSYGQGGTLGFTHKFANSNE